ncbi:ROK family transcriptional regulator [Nocardioides islandensis]|uniref:ROK family transcriptional regulator n=1 Tax=Nocardioides islandensis TaxID=433663 RepID=A0A930VBF0_9ACTN|nr:ROK family transcriptional regulator [Nocardioides islandensis]MBF4763353.1 ROK family transcriptional regulator [Nocardioides islandensis]
MTRRPGSPPTSPTKTGLGQEELRRNNLSALLTRVHLHGAISRASLTRELGLNRSTIGALAAELEDLGLVSERLPDAVRRSGRPSLVLEARRDNTVVGVDIGVDRIVTALVALGGEVLLQRQRPHAPGEHDVEHVIESAAQMIEEVLAARPDVRCLGVGVSVPGAVREADGLVRFAPNLGWVDQPFTEKLSHRLGRPVFTANDADLGVLAEHLRGAAVGYSDVAYLNGSVGIGGGFLVGGVPLSGARGYAGEVGHLLVDGAATEPCRCGNVGCWETKAGENHLLVAAGRLPGGGPDGVAEVIAAAAAGDQRATEALEQVAEWIGVGLRAVINIFDPEIIVLGGSLAALWRSRQAVIESVVDRWTLMTPRRDVLIRSSAFGLDSPWRGAAELVFAPLLADPAGVLDRVASGAVAAR